MSLEITGVNTSTVNTQYYSTSTIINAEDKAPANVNAIDESATYEKGDSVSNGTYSINKMSQADREKIVEQMKADAAQRQEQLVNLVRKTLSAQASAFGKNTTTKERLSAL